MKDRQRMAQKTCKHCGRSNRYVAVGAKTERSRRYVSVGCRGLCARCWGVLKTAGRLDEYPQSRPCRRYQPGEVEEILAAYPHKPLDILAAIYRRSPEAIRRQWVLRKTRKAKA